MAKLKLNLKKLLKYRLLLIPLVVVTAAVIALAQGNTKNSSNDNESTNPPGNPTVNLSPPTAEEKQETEDHKNQLSQQQSQAKPTTPSSSGNNQTTPIITEATKDRVLAYISGVVEDGGTCTATATMGSTTVSATASAFHDATTTDCAPMEFSSSLASGSWDILVSYSSSSSSGQSAVTPKTF
jgi:hypothetical protein